jgi:hypothetical protein
VKLGAEMETKKHISDELDPATVIAASKKWRERASKIRQSTHEELSCFETDFGLQSLQALQGLQALQ